MPAFCRSGGPPKGAGEVLLLTIGLRFWSFDASACQMAGQGRVVLRSAAQWSVVLGCRGAAIREPSAMLSGTEADWSEDVNRASKRRVARAGRVQPDLTLSYPGLQPAVRAWNAPIRLIAPITCSGVISRVHSNCRDVSACRGHQRKSLWSNNTFGSFQQELQACQLITR